MKKVKKYIFFAAIFIFVISIVSNLGLQFYEEIFVQKIQNNQDQLDNMEKDIQKMKSDEKKSYVKKQMDFYGLNEKSWNNVPYSATQKISNQNDLIDFILSFSRKDPLVEIFYPNSFHFSSSDSTSKVSGMLFIRNKIEVTNEEKQ